MHFKTQNTRGYTLIELLVVVSVTTFGLIALLQLQMGTLHSAAASRDMQQAINLAEHVSQTMRMEALQWSANSQAIDNTSFIYLKNAPVVVAEGQSSEWLNAFAVGSSQNDKRVGPLGSNTAYDQGILTEIPPNLKANYCVHYRWTWLIPDLLLRADVRVSWSKNKAQHMLYAKCPVTMESQLADINSITVPVSVMKNIFVRQI